MVGMCVFTLPEVDPAAKAREKAFAEARDPVSRQGAGGIPERRDMAGAPLES